MWNLKLEFTEIISFFCDMVEAVLLYIINFFINYSQMSFKINNFFVNYSFTFNNTCIFAFKFMLSIAFLVLIRGGTPRYRYDYLTKMGWLKFINIIIFIFFLTLLLYYLF